MENPRCLLCQSEKTDLFWNRVWNSPQSRVYACPNCRLLFLWPRITPDQQRVHYNDYGEHLVSRGVVPSYETAAEGFRRCEAQQLYRFDRLLPHFSHPAAFLEIGGGYGNFIGKLIEKGVVDEAVFVESCPERLAFVRDRFGINGLERMDQVRGRRFDFILMFHVLEHIDRPLEFISYCRGLLNHGGQMVIEVPSSADPLLAVYDCSAYKDFYFQPMHPAVYSQPALTYLMAQCGLVPSQWLYEQRYGLANHLHWLRSGVPGGNPGLESFIGMTTDEQYKSRLRQQKQTDTITGFFHESSGLVPATTQ